MATSASALHTARFCTKAALVGVLVYPLISAVTHLADTLPLHPIDRALTAGLFVVIVLTALICWLAGAYRTLLVGGGVLLSAALLTTTVLLIGG